MAGSYKKTLILVKICMSRKLCCLGDKPLKEALKMVICLPELDLLMIIYNGAQSAIKSCKILTIFAENGHSWQLRHVKVMLSFTSSFPPQCTCYNASQNWLAMFFVDIFDKNAQNIHKLHQNAKQYISASVSTPKDNKTVVLVKTCMPHNCGAYR